VTRVILDLDDYIGVKGTGLCEDEASLVDWIRGGLGGNAFEKMAADIQQQIQLATDADASPLPDELWFGKIPGNWPVYVFPDEGQALRWLEDDPSHRIWKAKIVAPRGYRAVRPKPYLEEVTDGNH
jgi:hypothetical protein